MLQLEIMTERGAEAMAPLRELLRRAAIDPLHRQDLRPALRRDRC
ncbi:hypothetical protein [Methylocapsa polymorpha]|nr:hypothetical protein [Methylocapsa sp. RX1]